jgi:xanthine dehydrogenase YagT iron-sulfur-binding subunit
VIKAAENGFDERVAEAFEKMPLNVKINGASQNLSVEPRVTLLDLLREQLHLTGTKKGCDHGQCGACTVHVNGSRVNSCLTLAVTTEGKEVTTIEGLAIR